MSAPGHAPADVDAEERVELLLRDLGSSRRGLSSRQAEQRALQYGANELRRRVSRKWPREILRQVTHPLALLLWLAAALSFAVGSVTVGVAVLLVIALNAAFAFVQELEAERAVEALAAYMPPHATALRDGAPALLDARGLVPGDIVLIEEGDRIPADARLLDGSVELDVSTLTGESAPVTRSADLEDQGVERVSSPNLVFSGTVATGGQATAIVFATGMHTELGRIAALSERVKEEPSPLEAQVRKVAWLIAAVAVLMSIAFVPLAILMAGLSLRESVVFAVGLLAGNVPEGLLPVITLALAVAVGALARRGALVKRLSAVETLGSTDVICTDKTGTLTENRMEPIAAWTIAGESPLGDGTVPPQPRSETLRALALTASRCNQARLEQEGSTGGDPTEIALLRAARALGVGTGTDSRDGARVHLYNFDPRLKLMSTLDQGEGARTLHTKGAPEEVLGRCTRAGIGAEQVELTDEALARVREQVEHYAREGLRVLALAQRAMPGEEQPARESVERDLTFLGLVTMFDPPRPEVADAVARCHSAGIRIIVITGDHPLTAAAIAAKVGIGTEGGRVVDAQGFDQRHEDEIERALQGGVEVIFARASPETKLLIAGALRSEGNVVAMTGDGVNDAPALRSADIGIAMGRSGTDVAREAATMVLTDDNFASIVAAVEAGRRVYDNVRKFILYIFAHATPEVAAFLVFALSGGRIPLPLPVLLLLCFDVLTETPPSLALGRDPAQPGIMVRPPRPRGEGVISRPMLLRAWLFFGGLLTVCALGCFLIVLLSSGWRPGDSVAAASPYHRAYLQATTMTFLALIAGQIGTAFAVHTEHGSLRGAGILSNRHLLAAIAAELLIAAVIVYVPPLQSLLGTAVPPAGFMALLIPCPLIVWGAERLRRSWVDRHDRVRRPRMPDPLNGRTPVR